MNIMNIIRLYNKITKITVAGSYRFTACRILLSARGVGAGGTGFSLFFALFRTQRLLFQLFCYIIFVIFMYAYYIVVLFIKI